MSRAGAASNRSSDANAATQVGWLDAVALLVLLAVLAARPMIGETFFPTEVSFLTFFGPSTGPTPAATAVLDTLLLAASMTLLVRRAGRPGATGWAVGAVLLAAGVVLSSVFALEQPVAWLAGGNLIALVLAGLALGCVTHISWMRSLALALILATGVTTAVKCIRQYTVELPDTRAHWEEVLKPQLLERGYELDDPFLVNYERRLQATESQGFLQTANITASILMMQALVAMGLVLAMVRRWRISRSDKCREPQKGASPVARLAVVVLLTGLLVAALWLTGSMGAMAAVLIGLAVLLVLGVATKWVSRHVRLVLALIVTGYVVVVAAVATYGMRHNSLPHPSLAFRWYYWTGGAKAYLEKPLTGLGRENFGFMYLKHKDPASGEEVKNPHNIWLSLMYELGPLGLLGGIVLGVLVLGRGLSAIGTTPRTPKAPRAGPPRWAIVATGVLTLLIQLTCADAAQGNAAVLIVWLFDLALVWGLALVAAVWVLNALHETTDTQRWLAAGLCAALVAALIHNGLSFALLTPGGLAVFIMLAAVPPTEPTATTERTDTATTQRLRLAGAAGGSAVVLGHLLFIAWPTAVKYAALAELERTPPGRGLVRSAERLIRAGAGDSAAARIAARAVLRLAVHEQPDTAARLRWFDTADAMAQEAVQRNPRDATSLRLAATVSERRAALHKQLGNEAAQQAALRSAAERLGAAVDVYPTNPRFHLALAEALAALSEADDTPERREAALQHLQAALSINAAREAADTTRLQPRELERITELREKLDSTWPSPASPPKLGGGGR